MESTDSISAESIGKVLYKDRKNAFSALNVYLKQNHPDKYAEYVELLRDEERRTWMASYILDPKSGGSSAVNVTSRSIEHARSRTTVWLTIEELGGPKYLNSMSNAKLMAKDLLSRPHESPSLATEGVLQYRYYNDKRATCRSQVR